MTGAVGRRDLVVLAADQDIEFALRGLLSRPAALGVRALDYEIYVHPEHDPGCLLRGADYLRGFSNQFERALVVLDRSGSGQEQISRDVLEDNVERQLRDSGWGSRVAAIVIDPELEAWVWSDSPEVARSLGWAARTPELRTWLESRGWLGAGDAKPRDPKKAYEETLRAAATPRSSSIFRKLAETVSVRRCADPAFQRLKTVLRGWFPAQHVTR